jgi:hypothetical protein
VDKRIFPLFELIRLSTSFVVLNWLHCLYPFKQAYYYLHSTKLFQLASLPISIQTGWDVGLPYFASVSIGFIAYIPSNKFLKHFKKNLLLI